MPFRRAPRRTEMAEVKPGDPLEPPPMKDFVASIRAVELVNAEMMRNKTDVVGGGTLECPACHGSLRFGFRRHPTGRGPGRRGTRTKQQFSFACDTPGCIRGSGH